MLPGLRMKLAAVGPVRTALGTVLGFFAACTPGGESTAASESAQQGRGDVFDEETAMALTVEAPLAPAFDAAHAGVPDGPLPGMPRRTMDPFPGKVSYLDANGARVVLDAELKVRGNSSLQECSFPKLTVKLLKGPARDASLFHQATKFKLGTHCGDEPEPGGRVGRFRNEKAAHREALAYAYYRLLAGQAAASPSLRTRPARVVYLDTASGQRTERDAFLLEHPDVAAERLGLPDSCRTLGGTQICDPVLEDAELEKVKTSAFDGDVLARILMLHALTGNFDFHVDDAMDRRRSLWNTDVLVLAPSPDGTRPLAPVPQDFDLSSMVTGIVRQNGVPATFLADEAPLVRLLGHYLKTYLAGRTPAQAASAKALLFAKKDALYAAATSAPLDADGRTNAIAHLDAFYRVLDADLLPK